MAVGIQMQHRRATAAAWDISSKVLAIGELGVTTDTNIIKIGDGVNVWSNLDPAFGSDYLPILGKAADSDLLDGISASGFIQLGDVTTAATADKVARRLSDGKLKAVAGTASDDVVNLSQMSAAISQEALVRTVTAATTIAATDVGGMVLVNHSSLTAQVVVTVPTNTAVPIAIGSWVDVLCIGAGGVKLTPSATVTLSGPSNVFPNYHMIRIIKTGTNTWIGRQHGTQQSRVPKIRAVRTGSSGYTAGSWFFVPYDSIDSTVDFYNPDSEWFTIPAAGLPTARRIKVEKAGEYLAVANFLSSTDALTYIRINLMIADNTLTGGRVLTSQNCNLVANASVRMRLAAGDSLGVSHLSPAGSNDNADGSFDYRNDFSITRIGD